jgi:hypothetical protein
VGRRDGNDVPSYRATFSALSSASVALFAVFDFTLPGEIGVAIFYAVSVAIAGWTRSRLFLWLMAALPEVGRFGHDQPASIFLGTVQARGPFVVVVPFLSDGRHCLSSGCWTPLTPSSGVFFAGAGFQLHRLTARRQPWSDERRRWRAEVLVRASPAPSRRRSRPIHAIHRPWPRTAGLCRDSAAPRPGPGRAGPG